MIEKTVLNHLSGALDVPCLMEGPEERPESYVLIQKTGSSRENHIFSSVFAVQSYGPSLFDAAELNSQVLAAMDSLTAHADVCACRLNSDYNYTDSAAKEYRYQAVFDIVHY